MNLLFLYSVLEIIGIIKIYLVIGLWCKLVSIIIYILTKRLFKFLFEIIFVRVFSKYLSEVIIIPTVNIILVYGSIGFFLFFLLGLHLILNPVYATTVPYIPLLIEIWGVNQGGVPSWVLTPIDDPWMRGIVGPVLALPDPKKIIEHYFTVPINENYTLSPRYNHYLEGVDEIPLGQTLIINEFDSDSYYLRLSIPEKSGFYSSKNLKIAHWVPINKYLYYHPFTGAKLYLTAGSIFETPKFESRHFCYNMNTGGRYNFLEMVAYNQKRAGQIGIIVSPETPQILENPEVLRSNTSVSKMEEPIPKTGTLAWKKINLYVGYTVTVTVTVFIFKLVLDLFK